MMNTRRITLVMLMLIGLSVGIAAQPQQGDTQKARPRNAAGDQEQEKKPQEPLSTSDGTSGQASNQDGSEEAAAVNPYYKNFFSTYRIGPEDVISVDVFNQPRYSRANIIVPPSGRVSLALIKGGVFVNGKT